MTINYTIKLLTFISLILFSNNTLLAQDIFDASREGNIETIQKLFKEDSKVINSIDKNGYSPLVLACYYGKEDVVKYLVDKVESIDGKTDYGSPLMAAAVKGYGNIVEILLQHKANPNITDNKGTTAAHYAVLFKNYDIVEQLVKAKADFSIKNNVDKSALDYAITHNDEKLNQLLKI